MKILRWLQSVYWTGRKPAQLRPMPTRTQAVVLALMDAFEPPVWTLQGFCWVFVGISWAWGLKVWLCSVALLALAFLRILRLCWPPKRYYDLTQKDYAELHELGFNPVLGDDLTVRRFVADASPMPGTAYPCDFVEEHIEPVDEGEYPCWSAGRYIYIIDTLPGFRLRTLYSRTPQEAIKLLMLIRAQDAWFGRHQKADGYSKGGAYA